MDKLRVIIHDALVYGTIWVLVTSGCLWLVLRTGEADQTWSKWARENAEKTRRKSARGRDDFLRKREIDM